MRRCQILGLALLVTILSSCDTTNQPVDEGPAAPDFDTLFATDIVHAISITTVEGWQTVLAAFFDAGVEDYWQGAVTIDGNIAETAGIRIKGTVKDGKGKAEAKYGLKLNFDYFGGQRLWGVDKIHLGNNKPDPSGLREALASRTYRAMGVHAVRTAFAVVDVDGTDFGNYTMIQHVDKRFLKDAFGTSNHADDGNLYQCVPPGCTLEWAGDSKSDYLFGSGDDAQGLVLETNVADPILNTYDDLIHFLDVLNNTSDEDFEAAIAQVFDVDNFLRWLAVAVAIGDFDNYLSWPDNFFLYHRPDTGLFVYLPWDHNKSYGAKKCKGSFEATGSEMDNPTCEVLSRPLVDRILAVDSYAQQYRAYLAQTIEKWANVEQQGQWIDELNQLVGWQIALDSQSFHTEDDYYQAISANPSTGSPPNLLDYIQRRHDYLTKALGQ
jgi:spore coat protein CotH